MYIKESSKIVVTRYMRIHILNMNKVIITNIVMSAFF
jgi:hypothetical protein